MICCSLLSAVASIVITSLFEELIAPLISGSSIYKSIEAAYGAAVSVLFILLILYDPDVSYAPYVLSGK